MAETAKVFRVNSDASIKVTKVKVKQGQQVAKGTLLCFYNEQDNVLKKLKSNHDGVVKEIFAKNGEDYSAGSELFTLEGCSHPTVMKDMCADCGADLRMENSSSGTRKEDVSASVAMVHSIPELIVSEELAKELGKADEDRLLRTRKLVLLVDLDQTIIHTTNDNIPANLKDVEHYQLWHGPQLLWYHTRIRPNTKKFLEHIAQLFELHICTFGSRIYAHTIAKILDPDGKYFSHRILSRDECFNASSKTANLKALFPCGDAMVCIIDDREDVWNYSPNLIHVKPYRFFQGTADINAPPGLAKTEQDDQPITHKVRRISQSADSSEEEKSAGEKLLGNKTEVEPVDDQKVNGDSSEACSAESGEKLKDSKDIDDQDEEVTSTVTEESKDVKTCATKGEKMETLSESKSADDTKVEKMEVSGESKDETVEHVDADEGTAVVSATEEKAEDGDKQVLKEAESCDTGDLKTVKANPAHEDGDKTDKEEESKEETELIEWDDDDDYLFHLEEVLQRIHNAFFDMYDQMKDKDKSATDSEKPNLRKLVPYVKKKVLKGCNIVFSGVIPTNMQTEKSRAYIVAKNLGANIQTDLKTKENESDPQNFTTHLVAARLGTQKTRTAQKCKRVRLVSQDWLWCCNERWERVEESLFPLTAEMIAQDRDSPDPSKMTRKTDLKRKADKVDIAAESGKDTKKVKTDVSRSAAKQGGGDGAAASTSGQDDGMFSHSYNPMLAFSDDDLAYMDKEVEDEMGDDENESSEDEDSREERIRVSVLKPKVEESETSSEDSMTGNMPRGWGLHRKTSPKSSSDDDDVKKSPPKDLGPEYESETDQDKFEKIMDAFGPETENSEVDNEDYQESIGSVDDEMADAIEKEFLSN